MSDSKVGGPQPRQDNRRPPPPDPVEPPERLSDDLIMGLRLFSRLPTGDRPFVRPDLSRIARGLAFTSVIIGALPALLVMLGGWVGLPSYFAAALGVGAAMVATGAMAEDALADACDGLFGGGFAERRLEIMKDSRHGTYGVAALCLYIVLRVTAIGALGAGNPLAAGCVWLAAGVIGRSGSLWLSLVLPHARPDGVSAAVGRVRKTSFCIGAGFAVVVAFVFAAPFTSLVGVALALFAAAGVALGWTALCRRLVGGQTGDLIGALQALIEVAALTALLAFA